MANGQLSDVVLRIRKAVARHPDDRSDAELLQAFLRRREEDAFAALLLRYGGLVLGICRRVLENVHDAEDAAQATFLVLARKASQAQRSGNLPGWLFVTARRIALQARRQACRRRRREAGVHPTESADPAAELMWREVQAVLDEEVQRLPQTQRSAFLLCCIEGLSHAEAGQRLGIAEGSVSSRVTRARQRLHGRLQRRGIELSAVLAALAVGSVSRAGLAPAARIALSRAAMAGADPASAALSGLSGNAINLARGASRIMGSTHIKLMAFVLLAAGVLGGMAQQIPGRAIVAQGESMPARPAPADRVRKPIEGVELKGRVLGPDGKPVRGAKLYVPGLTKAEPTSPEDFVMKAAGMSDASGQFQVAVPPAGSALRSYVIAYAPGFGVDWIDLAEGKPSSEVTFRLPRDVAIRGRVVNTEGKPVRGVSVSIASIYVPANGKLDDYLAGWKRNLRDNLATPRKRLYVPLDSIRGRAITDNDGRFTLHGAGAEHIVHVNFSGGGVAHSTPYVITREGFDPRPYNEVLLHKEHDDLRVLNRFLGLYGPNLTFVAEPGKRVEGMVRDGNTGKPLPGCTLMAHTGFGDGVAVMTDAAGRYHLDGLPKDPKGYRVSVGPPKGAGYLSRIALAPDSGGYTSIHCDIELTKGVVVSGRVVDRQTGRGVSCGIRFAPLPDNRYFGSRPGFDNYRSDRTMAGTDKEGRFRLVTIPGKALIMVQVFSAEKFHGEHLCPYCPAVPDPAHQKLFDYHPDDENWTISTAGGIEFLDTENAVQVIDIKEGGETHVELFVDRGVTGRVAIQDNEGRPLAGTWLAGMAAHWPITYKLPEATATVYALEPRKPRTLVLFHPEKRLGGTAQIRGDEKEPVVMKLGPLGQVSGRLRDVDGNPLAGAEISVNAQGHSASELYRFANPTGKRVVTDREGRFTLPGVVPGISFYLQIRQGEHFYGGKPKIGLLKVKAGQSLELGERTVEILR